MLFTGEAVTAEEAKIAGMVNRIVPRDDLERASLDLARRIALRPTMGVKLAKQAVNQSIDAQGLWTAVQAAYSLHLVGHTHNLLQFGKLIDPSGLEILRQLAKESVQS